MLKNISRNYFVYLCILTICVSGTLGITAKLWTLTNTTLKITIPEGSGGIVEALPFAAICYLDWSFLSLSILAVSILFIREHELRVREKK